MFIFLFFYFLSLFFSKSFPLPSPPPFQLSPQQNLSPKISKTLFAHSLWKSFYTSFPPPHLHHLIFLPLTLWNPPPSALELWLIQLLLLSRGGQMPLINPPLLTHQESTWIRGGSQLTRKLIDLAKKNSQILTKCSLTSKDSNKKKKKMVRNYKLGWGRNG